ncbi:LacI family transcriptional regulator [Pseudoxanthomonas kalamensis DSM 18571]|uniref:LacI family DNA-binding transcriptional regulator n=1 Tax=Pseudoxanthomonas kalamensis TaxID=289483 RepID=UPI001390C373|nr:LacI family DNA-binding transcriptional regulator [Pseudoxanthomonas kalamensis]KAF1710379.1 LacI family transcriptional regulator [Pseudoxanthomonas kalamensis DSM 18571]
MRVRIEDVAAVAGVSMKTVSRVLNREPGVREETRRRVESMVEKLGYRPNPSARSLAGQRSYMVALVFDNPSRNYLLEIQTGVLEACREHHYSMVLIPISFGQRGYVSEIVSMVHQYAIDGMVLVPPLADDRKLQSQLQAQGIPAALISPRVRRDRIGVAVDERTAARELVGELIQLGHRRIGHIKGPRHHGACLWRHDGYRDALQLAGIDYVPELVVDGEFTFDSGVLAGQQLLDLAAPPTAIFAGNDDMAAGVIRVAGMRGLSVPDDLSVCGFDDTEISRHIFPALTTVRQPTRDMGRQATLELLERIRDPQAGSMLTMPYALQLRESLAPPRAPG